MSKRIEVDQRVADIAALFVADSFGHIPQERHKALASELAQDIQSAIENWIQERLPAGMVRFKGTVNGKPCRGIMSAEYARKLRAREARA